MSTTTRSKKRNRRTSVIDIASDNSTSPSLAKDVKKQIEKALREELTPIVKAELMATLRPQVARELTLLLEPSIRKDLCQRIEHEEDSGGEDSSTDVEEPEEPLEEEDTSVDRAALQKELPPPVVSNVNMGLIASMSFEERQAFFSTK